jgi:formate/nitrite transporter FocA (FNT family)
MDKPDLPEQEKEPQKPYEQILVNELTTGLHEFERPWLGLLLSSLSGGLDVSFSVLLMAVVWTLVHDTFSQAMTSLLVANMYTIGFIFVVVGRSELFTEHTSRAMFPVISGQASWAALARLWSLVYVGNLVGVALFALVVAFAGPPMKVVAPEGLAKLAGPLVERGWLLMLVSGGLAGWLMGLMAWLVSACRDTISQIVVVWLIATTIAVVKLPHAIVGSGEVLASLFAGQGTTPGDFAYFLALTTVGNSIGGVVFVAALKYGHSTRGSDAAG